MKVTASEFVQMAARDEKIGGAYSWHRTFFQYMTAADREAFDRWLVETKDPLSFEPGTTEHRFRTKALAAAKTGMIQVF